MKITIEWSEAEQVATIFHEDVRMATIDDIAEWKRHVFSQLEEIARRIGRKPPLLVCIDGATIDPAVADEYGKGAKHVIDHLSTGLARYGNPSTVRSIIAVEAIKQGYKANLFETRDEARRHVLAHT